MKKIASLLLVLCMVFGLCAASANAEAVAADKIKIGFIYIGDENEGYTASHYNAAMEMKAALGLTDDQIIMKTNTPENEACYEAAVDLAEQGCNIIFSNSYSHESYMIQAAGEYPNIQFCAATGDKAASCGLTNVHNYFTGIFQARYLSGVVGGLKLNQLIADGKLTAETAKIGYVAAKPFAEVISGYTSFYLGARSVCPTATLQVIYTNSWSDSALEKEAAESLIADGCVLIGQHADTTGASTACEPAGVPIVGYNISMIPTAATQALVSPTNNWTPYLMLAVQAVINGEAIPTDWCGVFADDAVRLTELNAAAVAPGTVEKVAEVEAALKDGSLKVFDCSTFTVGGANLTTYTTAYGLDGVELISDGYFHESEVRSAPAFDIIIDGVSIK
ncbi:MAG: BMP family ABC transporter substrate-binding protein [Clostridia bacterium]